MKAPVHSTFNAELLKPPLIKAIINKILRSYRVVVNDILKYSQNSINCNNACITTFRIEMSFSAVTEAWITELDSLHHGFRVQEPPIKRIPGALLSGLERPECEAVHSRPSDALVNNAYRQLYFHSHIHLHSVVFKHREKLTCHKRTYFPLDYYFKTRSVWA